MRKVYLDYAATTPVRPEAVEAMKPYWSGKFGNPSSLHSFGQEARQAVETAREKVAKVLNCQPEEILFTGTTTTSDNLAILGTVWRAWEEKIKANNKDPENRQKLHLITSSIEHHSVLDTFKYLEKRGFRVTYLPVDKGGLVDVGVLGNSITPETVLVSVMYANNEVGSIQPIEKISKLIKERERGDQLLPIFHTDAATATEYLTLDTQKLGIDLLTLGSHKFGGPKGVGILFLKKGTKIDPITFGGHHEKGLWPGTEAVPLIVGMATALQMAAADRLSVASRVTKLRDKLVEGVLERVPEAILTGHPEKRLPEIASFCFRGAEGEAILLRLDAEGIAASSGSACTSGTLEPSHVLLAMGISAEVAHGSIRFSLGRKTTKEEIDYVLEKLPQIITDIRKMAPKP